MTGTPTRPKKPKSGGTTKKPASGGGSSGGSGSGSGSGGGYSSGGGGGGGGGGISASGARTKAGKRFLESAANLEKQAKALRHALKYDFAKARNQNLTDVSTVLNGQIAQLKLGHTQRSQTFLESAKNTEKATASTAEQGFSNLARERQDTMSSILEQGAGETDTLRTMLISARNWQANTHESNRAYFDSMTSVNSGITDLNVDTRGAFANAYTAAEGERDRLWQDFYNRRSETWTQLGNVLGQQADYYAQAKEMGVKPKKGSEKKSETSMANAFMAASKEAGKSYKQKALPDWVATYAGQKAVEARLSNTNLGASVELGPVERAEGATLKKWAS